ncbi:MAG: methyltransferase domain-containing protein [Pseudomonadota bacterium]
MDHQQQEHINEYDDATVMMLQLIWGEGFMAPGGPELVRRVFDGVDLAGKRILDIGCGLGGADIVLARDYGATIVAIDLEQPLIDRARINVERAGLRDLVHCEQVQPGPLAYDQSTFDIVFSIGAFTQTPNKNQMFSEVFRVLQPNGYILSYDWTKSPGPLSEDMKTWIKLEELTYEMETIESQCRELRQGGFQHVDGKGDDGWYAAAAQDELELIRGPLKSTILEAFGPEQADHFLANWVALVRVLEARDLVPAFFRGQKPA